MIKGENIYLRVVKENDLEVLYNYLSDLEILGEFFPHKLSSYPEFKELFYRMGFWNDSYGRMLITTKQNEKIVGTICYYRTVDYSDALEIGYIIFDKSNRNKGYASEALTLFRDYLFSTKQMNRLQLHVAPDYLPSAKVSIKSGFQFKGIREQFIYINGKHSDLHEYVFLRSDWKKEKK